MAKVTIPTNKLGTRGNQARRLLRHISYDRRNGPAFTRIALKGTYIIGCHGGQFRPTEDYQNWLFKTKITSVYGNYYELWKPVEASHGLQYYLFRVYLNLYELEEPKLPDRTKELVCLHCDPNEPADNDHSIYKQVPHIHIKAAKEPIPGAHFVLNLDFRDQVLESVESLFASMESAILMLRAHTKIIFSS